MDTRRPYRPENFEVICRDCGFATHDDKLFLRHCVDEHHNKGRNRASMRCNSCDFECDTTFGMDQHLQKKMHGVRSHYMSRLEYLSGDEEKAFDSTMKKYSFRDAEKAAIHRSSRKCVHT